MEPNDDEATDSLASTLDVVAVAQLAGLFMSAEVRRRLAAAGYGDLRDSHGYLLQHLLGPEPMLITELARRLGISQQAVSKSAAELEAHGYLERRPVERDRRARALVLTPQGRAMIQATRTARADLAGDLADVVGEAALDITRRTLERALRALDPAGTIATRSVRPPADRPPQR